MRGLFILCYKEHSNIKLEDVSVRDVNDEIRDLRNEFQNVPEFVVILSGEKIMFYSKIWTLWEKDIINELELICLSREAMNTGTITLHI